LINFLVIKDLAEVSPLSRGVIFGCPVTPIHPITGWHSLFPRSFTRYLISSPCGCLPLLEDVGLTVFCKDNQVG
jgi:hypothetical protein